MLIVLWTMKTKALEDFGEVTLEHEDSIISCTQDKSFGYQHKVQESSANLELLESTRRAEPVFKTVMQHFSSHNLFVLVI